MAADLVIRALVESKGAKDDLKGLGGAVKDLAVPAGVVTAAMVLMGNDVVRAASDGQQAAGALEAVFGTATAAMTANAEGAATSVGLAQSEYGQMAAVMGAQLSNMGIAQDEVAGTTDGLISMGADLAAQFGGSTSDAVAALSSLMRGERDPIEKYGVSITAASVEAQKAAMGLSGLTGEADRAATTQATLALLTDQTASAQGAFAREVDTAAGAQQIANATFENSKAALGEKLLPAVTAITQAFTGMATWVGENTTIVLVLAGIVGTLAGAIVLANVGMAAWKYATAAATAAQWLWNAAMSANPLGLILLAIVAVIAIIVLLVKNWDTVKAVALAVWSAISEAAAAAGRWISDKFNAAIQAISGFFTNLGTKAATIAGGISDKVGTAAAAVRDKFNAGIQAVVGFFTGLRDKAGAAVTAVSDGARRAATALSDAWRAGIDRSVAFFGNLLSGARDIVNRVIDVFMAIPRKVAGIFAKISIPSGIRGFLNLSAPPGDVAAAALGYTPGLATFASTSWAMATPSARLSAPQSQGPSVLIQVTGALDPVGVARQIRDLLNNDARRRGKVSLSGTVIA